MIKKKLVCAVFIFCACIWSNNSFCNEESNENLSWNKLEDNIVKIVKKYVDVYKLEQGMQYDRNIAGNILAKEADRSRTDIVGSILKEFSEDESFEKLQSLFDRLRDEKYILKITEIDPSYYYLVSETIGKSITITLARLIIMNKGTDQVWKIVKKDLEGNRLYELDFFIEINNSGATISIPQDVVNLLSDSLNKEDSLTTFRKKFYPAIISYYQYKNSNPNSVEGIEARMNYNDRIVDNRISWTMQHYTFLWEKCMEYDRYSWCKALNDYKISAKNELVETIKREFGATASAESFIFLLERVKHEKYMLKLTGLNFYNYSLAYDDVVGPAIDQVMEEKLEGKYYLLKLKGKEELLNALREAINKERAGNIRAKDRINEWPSFDGLKSEYIDNGLDKFLDRAKELIEKDSSYGSSFVKNVVRYLIKNGHIKLQLDRDEFKRLVIEKESLKGYDHADAIAEAFEEAFDKDSKDNFIKILDVLNLNSFSYIWDVFRTILDAESKEVERYPTDEAIRIFSNYGFPLSIVKSMLKNLSKEDALYTLNRMEDFFGRRGDWFYPKLRSWLDTKEVNPCAKLFME